MTSFQNYENLNAPRPTLTQTLVINPCAGQVVGALTRGRLGSGQPGAGSGGQQEGTPSTQERCQTAVRESHEQPVLFAINAERRRNGAEPLPKLTVRGTLLLSDIHPPCSVALLGCSDVVRALLVSVWLQRR